MREAWKRETYVRSQSFSSESAVKYLHVGRRKIQISPPPGEQDKSNALLQGQQRQSNPHPKTPKKSHAKFPSDKNFSSFVELCGWAHTGTTTNLQIVLTTRKNPYLNQATPQKILYFPSKKNPSIIPVTSNLEYPPGCWRLPLY